MSSLSRCNFSLIKGNIFPLGAPVRPLMTGNRIEIEIGCPVVKALVWSASVVQRDEAAPIGPKSVRSFILGIHGPVTSFTFMR